MKGSTHITEEQRARARLPHGRRCWRHAENNRPPSTCARVTLGGKVKSKTTQVGPERQWQHTCRQVRRVVVERTGEDDAHVGGARDGAREWEWAGESLVNVHDSYTNMEIGVPTQYCKPCVWVTGTTQTGLTRRGGI